MNEVKGDLWELAPQYDAIVITTNGTVKKNGEAVMGRGCALEAAQKYPRLKKALGSSIALYGNSVNLFFSTINRLDYPIFSFPVKHNWYEKADINLIEASARELVDLTTELGYTHVLLPRPGCGNGGLDWADVKPILEPILDERFTVVSW